VSDGNKHERGLNLTLHVWRQKDRQTKGKLVTYKVQDVSTHASFLEMLDVLNEQLIERGEEPVAFDHDCREGICGMCSLMINGRPHGGQRGTTVCQLHMRLFKDGDEIWIEPWRAAAFPVLRDLCVDRSAFDKVIQAGGYIANNTGSAPDANDLLVSKEASDAAMDAAGFGACSNHYECEAACPKEIKRDVMAQANRDYARALFGRRKSEAKPG
jgi:succinate dehydrogenase / fumarate reductase iron-sulfur subunit